MNFKAILTFNLFFSLFFVTFTSFSQAPAAGFPQQEVKTDFNDKEVKKFVKVVKKVIPIEEKAQKEMIEEVQNQGLSVEKFNKIAAIQQGQAPNDSEVSDSDLNSFAKASKKIGAIQKEAETEIMDALKKENMPFETYQQMILAYQQDSALKQRVDEIIQKG